MEIRSNLSSLMEHGYEGAKDGKEKRNLQGSSTVAGDTQSREPVNTPHKSPGAAAKDTVEKALIDVGNLGEFEDKKGLEQTTDVGIGPDIRYALTSKNPEFIKRILWGPLTVDEYRELKYRLRELHNKKSESSNLLSGKTVEKNMIQAEELQLLGEKSVKSTQDKNIIDIVA